MNFLKIEVRGLWDARRKKDIKDDLEYMEKYYKAELPKQDEHTSVGKLLYYYNVKDISAIVIGGIRLTILLRGAPQAAFDGRFADIVKIDWDGDIEKPFWNIIMKIQERVDRDPKSIMVELGDSEVVLFKSEEYIKKRKEKEKGNVI